MSKHTRRTAQTAAESSKTLFAKAEQELAEGYLEVEITGLTLRRLAAAYRVIARNAFAQTVDNVRSLLRPNPVV